jgi:DNA-binding transcriptional regulator YiaG
MRGKPENLRPRTTPAPTMSAADFRSQLRELGLSQAWLARKLGKAPHTVGKWAGGELRVPEYVAFTLELLNTIRRTEENLRQLRD